MKKKAVLFTGVIVYLLLLIMAVVFFKERTVFLDSSYHLFQIIYNRALAIQGNRFGAALTQIYPLIAVKLNLSLHTVAVVYSMSFIAFFALSFFVTLFRIKNIRMALSIVLFNVLMVTHTFYWPHPELPSGVVFTLLYFAWVERYLKEGVKNWTFLMATPFFVITIVFFHPLLIFVFFFLVLYFFFLYRKGRIFLLLLSAGYILTLYLKTKLFVSPYEQNAMEGLNNISRLFPHYFNIMSNKNLFHYFIRDYYLVAILLIVVLVFFTIKREYLKLLLTLLFFFGLCFIINLNYAYGAAQFYLEAQYLLLSVFVIVPFVYDVLPKVKRPQLSFGVVFAMAAISLVRIWKTHDFYSTRVDWYRNFLVKTSGLNGKKLILASDEVPMNTLLMTWGSSYEFWLLSTLEQGNSRSVIIEDAKGEFDWAKRNNKAFTTKWGQFEYSTMNERYFKFKDTLFYKHY